MTREKMIRAVLMTSVATVGVVAATGAYAWKNPNKNKHSKFC